MNSRNKENETAILYSPTPPDERQKERFAAFLREKYQSDIALEWTQSDDIRKGFRLVVGSEVYDWSESGRFAQLRELLTKSAAGNGNIIALMKEALDEWTPEAVAEEIGTVDTVGDGIAVVTGLDHAFYGEILIFPGGIKGMVQDLRRGEVGCILFGGEEEISEGDTVKRTGKMAGMPVGDAFIGRVVDALGSPIDGKGIIRESDYRPIEAAAPSIIDRQPVNVPLETGLLAIDSMFPIGRGQRELIIGDRQTGKTTIATDTILNQKGKGVVCIYVAIGQKASSVAQLVENLRKRDAMKYTIVVNASASESAPLQYIAPYAGCALAEYFMNQGRDVLIVYDDLSKHAIAYRSLSLLLDRSPGREAYPGDVFYLHSRLLERAAHLSDEKGGGSITALPIVETQAGDVSAYIPTNIISITDGQIFLESDLFFSGQRPAVNVGISVSRVGGDAQTKAMKSAAGPIRLDLAQYREMEVFTQFSSDLDETTKRQLAYGESLMELLKQPQYHPRKQYEQVVLLVAATEHVLQEIPTAKIRAFAELLLCHMEQEASVLCGEIERTGTLSKEGRQKITDLSRKFAQAYMQGEEEQGR
ncbi:MAG: F0F1 ATP synthase subunit alpha [Roseburia sp.]|nr:F0F1 ATP synthase subunit alpha [Roseburia sp.]